VHIFKDQRIAEDNIEWSPTPDAHSPWDYQWIDFIDAIRNDKPFNQAKRAVYADYASLMGRAAAHYNRVVTWDEVVKSQFQFCDYLDDLNYDSPAPVKPTRTATSPPRTPASGKSCNDPLEGTLKTRKIPCARRASVPFSYRA
jgi:hypothetical protein